MRNLSVILRSTETISIGAASHYESLLSNSNEALERIATGTIWKSGWFAFVWLMSNLSPLTLENKLEPALLASSKRHILGKSVSDSAWKTYQNLARVMGFSNRELRIAAMRSYVGFDGNIRIDMNRERFMAFIAWVAITAQALVCTVMVGLLWSVFDISLPILLVLAQVVLYGFATLIVLVMLFVFAYSIFVRGVLPLSVAHKFRSKQWGLTLEGIPCQIIG